jgi:sugar phosphate isomerase/epimerase
MSFPSRRQFLKNSASGAAVLGVLSACGVRLRANPLGLPIGCQTWPVRSIIAHDFPGAIKQLAAAGFQSIELCSPWGYSDSGFGGLQKYKPADLKKLLADSGVTCISSHFGIGELRKHQSERIAWAHEMGLTQMLVPSLNGKPNPTADDLKRAADEYNKMGEQSANAGIQQGLHNEDFELTTVDGKRTYDVLLSLMDPKFVKFQFQCSTIAHGYVAADYFRKYPGHFISMHVQDWSPQAKKEVAVGTGSIDWKDTFSAAKIGGIKNYFVEMDLAQMQASVPYLRTLQV